MEYKYTNLISEIFLASKVSYVEFFFEKIVKIEFKNESYKSLSQDDAMIVHKTKISITFTLLIQME